VKRVLDASTAFEPNLPHVVGYPSQMGPALYIRRSAFGITCMKSPFCSSPYVLAGAGLPVEPASAARPYAGAALEAGTEWVARRFYSPASIVRRLGGSRTGIWWNLPRNFYWRK